MAKDRKGRKKTDLRPIRDPHHRIREKEQMIQEMQK